MKLITTSTKRKVRAAFSSKTLSSLFLAATLGNVIKSHTVGHLPDMTRDMGSFIAACDELKYERLHQFLKARNPNFRGDHFDVAMLNWVRGTNCFFCTVAEFTSVYYTTTTPHRSRAREALEGLYGFCAKTHIYSRASPRCDRE
jgi:hypothetical protein